MESLRHAASLSLIRASWYAPFFQVNSTLCARKMRNNKDHSFKVLIIFLLVFLVNTIVGVSNIFESQHITQEPFDPKLWSDWLSIIALTFLVAYLVYLVKKIKDKWAKVFWVIIAAYFCYCVITELLTYYFSSEPILLNVIVVFMMFLFALVSLLKYKRQRYELFPSN